MRPTTSLLILSLGGFLAGVLQADPVPQPQVSFTAGSAGTWNADWEGVAIRTYFGQASTTLTSWNYAPVIHFSDGLQKMGVFTDSVPKFFFRLKYTDAPTTEPNIEDFDSDGIGSLTELLIGHDPFVAEPFVDSDGDTISDAVEMHWYNNLTSMTATSDADLDGIPDVFEVQTGGDPTLDQSTDTEKRTDYQYDKMGRLIQAGDEGFDFDVEGNLEGPLGTP